MDIRKLRELTPQLLHDTWNSYLRSRSEALRNVLLCHYARYIIPHARSISKKTTMVEADDLFSAGCIRLAECMETWDDKGSFYPSFVPLVRGAMIDALRKLLGGKGQQATVQGTLDDGSTHFEMNSDRREDKPVFSAIVHEEKQTLAQDLNRREQLVVALTAYEAMTTKQISLALGLTTGMVSIILRSARAKLAPRLGVDPSSRNTSQRNSVVKSFG